MGVFFDLDDEYEIEITREEVASETSVDDLKAWHERLTFRAGEMSIMAKAFAEGGIEDRGLCFKLGNYRIAQRWIESRLQALGEEYGGGSTKEKAQAKEIARLLEQTRLLREQVSNYRALLGVADAA